MVNLVGSEYRNAGMTVDVEMAYRRLGNLAVFVLTLSLIAAPVSAQDATRDSRTPEAQASPTAEELLKELRKDRTGHEIIPPGSGPWDAAKAHGKNLWPEGWALVDVGGHLERDGSWWVFASDSDHNVQKVRLLPNATLEVLVRTATNAPSPIRFIVSGRTTVFHQRNYLLLQSVARDRRAAPAPPPKANAKPVATDADVADVLGALQKAQVGKDVLDTRPVEDAQHTGTRLRPLLPDGAAIISRPARVVKLGPRYDLVFESDDPDNPEPPLTMLPNLDMERMLKAVADNNYGQVFRVSGDVTQFEGRNYILVRSAPRQADTANFRK